MAVTLRDSDNQTERAVAQFLDRYFYPKHATSFTRYDDIINQMNGIDVSCTIGEVQNMLIDEKCVGQYINQGLPTFAFELSFFTMGGQMIEGWLFDPQKRTQYYLLIWIWATRTEDISVDDITTLECILMSREKLLSYLNAEGITRLRSTEIVREIRSTTKGGVHYKRLDRPYYYFLTTRLAEQPVNLVIRKSKLKELGERNFFVRK